MSRVTRVTTMRAILTSFDNFMAMFVAMLGVFWSTVFMPLLGGPLHSYEAQAIGAGWHSLQSGQAANIGEALEIASSLPVEAVFPSAQAAEVPLQLVAIQPEPGALELLGGPETEAGPVLVTEARRTAPRVARARERTAPLEPLAQSEPIAETICDAAAMKQGVCETAPAAADALAAST
jgi:hypothetical protein